MGPHTWPSLPPSLRREVEHDGFLWIDASENAYHSTAYVQERWSAHFDVLDVIPHGVVGYQDLVVARRTWMDCILASTDGGLSSGTLSGDALDRRPCV